MKKNQKRYNREYLFYGQRNLPRRYPKKYKPRGKTFQTFKITLILILVLVLIGVYIIFFSPIFKIKEIKISGNQVLTNEEIQSSLDDFLFNKFLIFFNRDNIFLAKNGQIKNIIFNDFPRIVSIEVNKNIFEKTIRLKIVERKEIGILCKVETQKKEEDLTEDFYRDCYYIDKNGVIFEEAPQTSGTLILVIKDYSGEKAEIGKSILEKELVAELVDLRNYLFEQLNLKVVDFAIRSKSSKDVRIDTHEGWYILFDSSRDFKKQVEALRLILEKKVKGERNNLEYVDLRIENRAYYK